MLSKYSLVHVQMDSMPPGLLLTVLLRHVAKHIYEDVCDSVLIKDTCRSRAKPFTLQDQW